MVWFLGGAFALMILGCTATYMAVRGAHGFSALDPPTMTERWIANTARGMAIPSTAKQLTNPAADSAEVLAEARAHSGRSLCVVPCQQRERGYGNGQAFVSSRAGHA